MSNRRTEDPAKSLRFEQKLNQFVALWLYYTRQTLSILPHKIKPNEDKPNNRVEREPPN